jgi:ComF family protein
VAALLYADASIHLVHAFKFRGDLAAGATLAALLLDAVRTEADPDALVPVPLSRARRRSRGFDQSLELARLVARARRLRLLTRGIERRHEGVPQSTLADWEARWRNVCSVFHVKPGCVSGLRIAVVDDVMTSGATAQAFSRSLIAAGAAQVHLWVACRAGLRR